eukprot:2061537-Pyramimonas_sp.AAC.1
MGREVSVKCSEPREPRNRDDEVKNTGSVFKVCCTVHEGHKRPKHGVTAPGTCSVRLVRLVIGHHS